MSAPLSLAKRLFAGAVSLIRPRPRGEIYEWARDNLVLSTKVTSRAGPVRFDDTPYQIGPDSPFWAYKRYGELIVIWPTQVGKTLTLQILLAWTIACSPGPGMIVYPDQVVCKRRSKKHIRPLIEDCLSEHTTGRADDLTVLEYMLKPCSIFMAWSGSPSVLAAESIKYLFLDEIAKHADGAKGDADAVSLAKRRISSYGAFSRVYACTTPLSPEKPGWDEYSKSTKHRFHVRCHACKESQVMFWGDLDWKAHNPKDGDTPGAKRPEHGGVKWISHGGRTLEETAATAYYECQHCQAHWNDVQINDAVADATRESIADHEAGRERKTGWLATHPDRSRYGCHAVSWLAPWNRLAGVVQKWLESYGKTSKRQDFCNSDLAVPYIEEIPGLEEDIIKAHQLPGHNAGIVPEGAVALILTTDVMGDHYRYRIRAWAPDLTSWGVEEGQLLPDFPSLDRLMQRTWPDVHGRPWTIARAIIDSGFEAKKVYTWCARYPGRAFPLVGRQNIREIVKFSEQAVPADTANGLTYATKVRLIVYHQDRWRDDMLARLQVTADSPGAWHLETGISDEFCHQMVGDVRRRINLGNGHFVTEWLTVHANHAWDCEVYQLVAAHVFQIAGLQAPPSPQEEPEEPGINPITGKPIV
jgi:phage terminase large subunit GpA-like protein